MSIEQAAAAFDADMGNKSMSTNDKSGRTPPAEPIFNGLGNLEVDDDSPEVGGGDDSLPEGVQKQANQPRQQEDDNDPDDDAELDDENDEDDAELDDESDEDDDPLLAREFDVMVDGEEVKVSVRDALNNFTHREAVDRRMNFVEQARRVVIQEGQKVVAQRQKIDEKLAEAEAILEALIPAEPNWDELFSKDPGKARELQKQYDGFKAKVSEIQEQRAKHRKEAEEEDAAATIEYRNNEARKFAAFAKWDSAKARDKDLASMRRTALSLGFSEQEVGSVMDSRMLGVLLKASKYDRMMANKPKPVTTRQQRSDNPGAKRNGRAAPKGNDRAMKTLQRTGSVEAAASVFEGILKRSN